MTETEGNIAPDTLTIGVSKSRRLHAMIIAGLLTFIGLVAFLFGDGHAGDGGLIALVCLCLAACMLYSSRGAWTKDAAMTINKDGLWYKDWNLPVVPWHHVADAYSDGSRIRLLLRIDLRDGEGFFAGLDEKTRQRMKRNPLIRPDRLVIPHNALEMSVVDLSSAIRDAMQRDHGDSEH
jgi:hypothetical protein